MWRIAAAPTSIMQRMHRPIVSSLDRRIPILAQCLTKTACCQWSRVPPDSNPQRRASLKRSGIGQSEKTGHELESAAPPSTPGEPAGDRYCR